MVRVRGRLWLLVAAWLVVIGLSSVHAAPAARPLSEPAHAPQIYLPLIQQPQPPVPNIQVASYTMYIGDGDAYLVGEVINVGERRARLVILEARFYDSAGQQLVLDEWVHPYLRNVNPGQCSPFAEYYPHLGNDIAKVEVTVDVGQVDGSFYEPLTIVSQDVRFLPAAQPEYGQVYGAIRNDYTQDVPNPRVVATFYDAEGYVVDAGMTEPPVRLSPGQHVAYAVDQNINAPFSSYALAAEGFWEGLPRPGTALGIPPESRTDFQIVRQYRQPNLVVQQEK